MAEARAHIGTSGWNYPHWRGGVFYPRGLPAMRWLAFYAQHFGTVELNTTFYGLPKPRTVAAWRSDVPSGFVFAAKASRFITHVKRLGDPGGHVGRFLEVVAGLGPALGPVLFQFPGRSRPDPARLQGLAAYLGQQRIVRGVRVALEVRDARWLEPGILKIIEESGWALCLADWPGLPVDGPAIGPFVYLRRHGPGPLYASGYSPAALRRDAERVAAWLAEGRDVYVYFNNDARGYAVRDAGQLGRLVGERTGRPPRGGVSPGGAALRAGGRPAGCQEGRPCGSC